MTLNHAVVWIDHHEARIFQFDRSEVERLVIHPDHPTHHLHHKANAIGSGHAPEDQDFLHAVARALSGVEKILIVGPANAKTELVKHLDRHDPQLGARVVGVETVDHPSDKSIVAQARAYFKEDHQTLPRSQ